MGDHGAQSPGLILVIIHTLPESLVKERKIRIISARKATKREVRQYEES
jgi:uncharacterized DUF497 family protein